MFVHNEFIGNPSVLISQIGTGTEEFFKYSIDGFKTGNPKKIGQGVVDGTSSLVKHTAEGVLRTIRTASKTIADASVIATTDDKFQKKRAQAIREEVKNPIEGVGRGI